MARNADQWVSSSSTGKEGRAESCVGVDVGSDAFSVFFGKILDGLKTCAIIMDMTNA